MEYLAVLGRQSEISLAELGAQFSKVKQISDHLALFSTNNPVDIDKLGGSLKIAKKLDKKPLDYLMNLPEGKITFGLSDYSDNATMKSVKMESLKLKKILVRHGRSIRVVENKEPVLNTATSLHNGLSAKKDRKLELIKYNNDWFKVIGIQDIDAYSERDQKRPARDAKVGMLPPKLAQILINLCGPLKPELCILDPFCGTGVVLQEALLMGYRAYGTDLNERMVEYTKKNLQWLESQNLLTTNMSRPEKDFFVVSVGDATSFKWQQPIDAVACEGYLGKPMSQIPTDIKLKEQKQECSAIILGFLKNLADQIETGTPVVIATPAWLRENGKYSRLENIDEIENMGYNVNNKSREGLLYHREGQIVARDILILRKK